MSDSGPLIYNAPSDTGNPGHTQHAGNGNSGRKRGGGGRFMFLLFVLGMLGMLIYVVVGVHKTQQGVADNNTMLKQQMSMLQQTASLQARSFACNSVPPRKYQLARGTCWDFGTIAALEHQYRLQGIANGWLTENQYVQLSEQAYGNRIIKLCAANQHLCLLPGDNVAFNSTEGGEASLLGTFSSQLENLILPHSVCPYINPADNSSCPGIDQALAHNPIMWTMDSSNTIYDIPHIKAALQSSAHGMPLSVAIHTTNYYIPCTDNYVKGDPQCTNAAQCTACPPDKNFDSPCCYVFNTQMFKMNGEFFKHHAIQPEAGHVMLLVGFNDDYRTEDGYTGGLIMRNTWLDGVYSFDEADPGSLRQRGSHSLAYFMQQISDADERLLCPNSNDPRQWYSCGSNDVHTCVGATPAAMETNHNAITAKALMMPYHLKCRPGTNGGSCVESDFWTYFSVNTTTYGDDLTIMCFMGYNNMTMVSNTFCLSPRPLDQYSLVFMPRNDEDLENDDDFCGFYFFPYDLARESQALLGGFWVNDYHVTFASSAYETNADAALDYSLVSSSTGTQAPLPHFDGPYFNDLTGNARAARIRTLREKSEAKKAVRAAAAEERLQARRKAAHFQRKHLSKLQQKRRPVPPRH